MKYDQDKVDEMTLALLYLVSSRLPGGPGARAWKGFDGATMANNGLFLREDTNAFSRALR